MSKMEMMIFPSDKGMIKLYIYGFQGYGNWGKVYATYNDITVSSKGYHRKKAIVRSLVKIHESLVNKENNN
jgi:hypothetical protein